MTHHPDRVSSLPKWAQEHINSLMNQIENLKSQVAGIAGEPLPENDPHFAIGSGRTLHREDARHFPPSCVLQAHLSARSWIDLRIVTQRIAPNPGQEPHFRLQASRAISIQPQAANSILIVPRDF